MADDVPMFQLRRSVAIRVGIIVGVLAALGIGFAIGFAVHSPSGSPGRAASTTFHTTTTTPKVNNGLVPARQATTTIVPTQPGSLPITVESDAQMQEEGNNGPSSSVLLPTSCQVTGTTVTAMGTYEGGPGNPVGEAYVRYGDIVELYLFTAPSTGLPQGAQLAASPTNGAPNIGGYGNWQVSTTFDPSVGAPVRCVVAAQPTHDVQLAP